MIEAAKLISDLEARGVKVKIPAANKLRLTGPRDAVEAFRNEVLRRKFEIISILERKAKSGGQKRHVAPQARNVPYIPDVDQFEEIAALIEYEEGLRRDTAEDVSAMLMGFDGAAQYRNAAVEAWRHVLDGASERLGRRHSRMHQMISDGLALLERWGDEAVRCGWNSCELFGVCPATFDLRLDRCGLVYFVGGGRIQSVSRNLAVIERPASSPKTAPKNKTVYRNALNADGGAVPVWEFQRQERQ